MESLGEHYMEHTTHPQTPEIIGLITFKELSVAPLCRKPVKARAIYHMQGIRDFS